METLHLGCSILLWVSLGWTVESTNPYTGRSTVESKCCHNSDMSMTEELNHACAKRLIKELKIMKNSGKADL